MKNDSDIKNTKETLQFDIAFSEAEGMDSTVATLSFFPEMEEILFSEQPLSTNATTAPQVHNGIELLEPLGEGGMGIVYEAKQFFPKRRIAVKKLKNSTVRLSSFLLEEAMVMGLLEHPNIPPVHSLRITESEELEVWMKRIEGETFEEILDSKVQVDGQLHRALSILIQVCHAVEYAHSKNIIHRDIKPENITVGAFNQVYLMDWGLGMHLGEGRRGLVGTPAYLATEMLAGEPSLL